MTFMVRQAHHERCFSSPQMVRQACPEPVEGLTTNGVLAHHERCLAMPFCNLLRSHDSL